MLIYVDLRKGHRMWKFFLIYFLIVNIISFVYFGIDKRKAKRGLWRIPEKTLFFLAMIGGSVGAIAGMFLFRHKTKHKTFTIGIPLIFFTQIGGAVYFMFNIRGVL